MREKTDVKRRDLLAAGVVMFGAVAAPSIASAQVGSAPCVVLADGLDPLDAIDPAAPKGLKPHATVDARFPVSYQRSVPAACRVMTAHFGAIAQRDYAALAKTMHFPCAIVERVDVVPIDSPADLTNTKAPASLNFSPHGALAGDHQSRLEAGAYDMMISLEVINFDPAHVNMAMTFDRYNKQGFRTLRCEGIYCVTNNDGRWAIQLLSTIWKPDQYVGMHWPDAEEAALRLRENHTDSYENDLDVIDRPRPTRGPTASITGGGSASLFGTAASGDPMELFKVRGVKTRLRIVDRSNNPQALNPDPALRRGPVTVPQEPKWAGQTRSWEKLGIDNWWEGRIAPDYRIIHSWSDKVHRYAGAARYNAAGELLNVSMETSAVVLGSGTDWVETGNFRYVTTHDRLNDEMND